MNPMLQMKDPAAGIPRELLPHLHLVSKHRYPVTNTPSLETIVAYLLEAPKVVRESAPVQWQYLDCPQDGTLFLAWQPPDLGVNFASDGYVWADQEAPFNSDVRSIYTLQMFIHKSGFRPQGETMASHSRRRYRLLPSQQTMGNPMPDPSLWLIHYSKAASRDHVPVSSVGILPQVSAQMQQRRMIMSSGALARKEFMLHDRANWPTINLPGGIGRHASGGQLGPNAHRRGQSLGGHEPTVEEEEDVSRGDALDFMTPRDISRMRYEQHHEWMEEILESPYRTMQIIPPDLGLGRKGELESLTKDFFHAPTSALPEPGPNGTVPRVGRLEPGKAEDFTRLANQKIADMQSEIQKMKLAHQRRMEKLRKVTALSLAEKKLRSASSDLGHRKSILNGGITSVAMESDPIDEIVKEVEDTTGKKIERMKNVTCVAKGGYQEPKQSITAVPEQAHNPMTMNKQPANASIPGPQQQQIPAHLQAQQPAQISNTGSNQINSSIQNQARPTIADNPEAEVLPKQEQTGDQNSSLGDEGVDIEMTELDEQPPNQDEIGDASEWVMVDDNNMADSMDIPSLDQIGKSMDDSDPGQDHTPLNTGFTPEDSASQTPQATDQQQHQQRQHSEQQTTGQTPLDSGDFDFDDVNTAGDALADYGADDDDLNLDNMDDSAFGDAFHATDDHDLS